MTDPPTDLISPADAARLIGRSRQWVGDLVARGRVRAYGTHTGAKGGLSVSAAEVKQYNRRCRPGRPRKADNA